MSSLIAGFMEPRTYGLPGFSLQDRRTRVFLSFFLFTGDPYEYIQLVSGSSLIVRLISKDISRPSF